MARALLLAVAVSLLPAPTATAQHLAYDGQGITLMIAPETPWAGGHVTISGATAPAQNNRTVTARFEPPEGAAFTRRVRLKADGTYAYTEGDLAVAGTWTVRVQGPLVEETAVAMFEVQQPAVAAATSMASFRQGAAQALAFLNVMETEVERFTELPDREAALQQIQALQDIYVGFVTGHAALEAALERAAAALPALTPFPEFQQGVADLAETLAADAQALEALRQELHLTHEQANQTREWCRMWHAQKQGLRYVFQMVQKILDPGIDLRKWVENRLKKMVGEVRTKLEDAAMQQQLGLTQQQVADARSALKHWMDFETAVDAATDGGGTLDQKKGDYAKTAFDWLLDWYSKKVSPNCRMYDATAKGTLRIDYYTKGVVYMVAKYRFEGKIELFFQRRQGETDQVRLKGQLWGKFDWRIGQFFPERVAADIPGVSGVGLCIPRPPSPDIRDFYLTLEGEGFPNAAAVEITGVNYDWERLPYRFISVLWSPYQMVPTVDFPEMDVPGGHWFVTRVTQTAGEEKRFRIPLRVSGDEVIMKHIFRRTMDYVSQNEFLAVLTLVIDGEESTL